RGRGLHRLGGGGRRDLTRPDQHGTLLVAGTLLDLNDFHLQVVEVRVVKVELALERPIRHTAALTQQCEDLIQHRVKVHHRHSLCLSGNPRTTRLPLKERTASPLTVHAYPRRGRSPHAQYQTVS